VNRLLVVSFGEELEKVLSIIDRQKNQIMCVITFPVNDFKNIVKRHNVEYAFFYDKIPEIVKEKYFDYVIVSDVIKDAGTENRFVTELKRCGVPEEKILNMSHFASFPFFSICNALKNFTDASEETRLKYKFFVTGVSHAYAGTDVKEFSVGKGLNLALTSQDLFYDYELAKIVLKNKREIKFAVIGVAPFSLHSDLTQCVNHPRALAYWPIVKTLHNSAIKEEVLFEIFNDAYLKSYELFDTDIKFDGCLRFCGQNKNFFMEDWMNVRKLMANQEAKVYLPTLEENKQILKNYVADCLKADVFPLLVIYPVSEFYNSYFPKWKFEEVRYFLNDLSSEYDVPYYDFSNDQRFSISDFFDIEHLNMRGAKKFSKILDKKLTALEKERSN